MNLLITNPTSANIDFMFLTANKAKFDNVGPKGAFVENKDLGQVSLCLEKRIAYQIVPSTRQNRTTPTEMSGKFAISINQVMQPYIVNSADIVAFFEEHPEFNITAIPNNPARSTAVNLLFENTSFDVGVTVRFYLISADAVLTSANDDTAEGYARFYNVDTLGGSFEANIGKALPPYDLNKYVAHAGVVTFDFDPSNGPMTIIDPETKEETTVNTFEELVALLKANGYEVTEVDSLQNGVTQ